MNVMIGAVPQVQGVAAQLPQMGGRSAILRVPPLRLGGVRVLDWTRHSGSREMAESACAVGSFPAKGGSCMLVEMEEQDLTINFLLQN